MTKIFSKSTKKHIRREKARIRREILDLKEQAKKIQEIYSQIAIKDKAMRQKKVNLNKNEDKSNIRTGNK
ncbi:MAG: hypothetical protein PHW72_00315 [Candidatus Pacebacteria bacterium]|nr:hypothetical protein [Candidatus Paceibacterota bacterium]